MKLCLHRVGVLRFLHHAALPHVLLANLVEHLLTRFLFLNAELELFLHFLGSVSFPDRSRLFNLIIDRAQRLFQVLIEAPAIDFILYQLAH